MNDVRQSVSKSVLKRENKMSQFDNSSLMDASFDYRQQDFNKSLDDIRNVQRENVNRSQSSKMKVI